MPQLLVFLRLACKTTQTDQFPHFITFLLLILYFKLKGVVLLDLHQN